MTESSDAIFLKIKRADEHLATLHEEMTAFVADREVIGQFEPDTSEYVFRVDGCPPPLNWGITVGEFAHNLRSALDNLLWSLIQARGKRPTPSNQFPIYEHVRLHKRKAKKPVLVPAKDEVRRLTKGVGPDDFAFIERAQPYHDGQLASRHPLALLGHLNNIDKHRFIHPAFACFVVTIHGHEIPIYDGIAALVEAAGGARFPTTPHEANADAGEIIGWSYNTGMSGDDRTEIMRVTINPAGPDPKVEMQPSPAVHISLSDAERPMLFLDLVRIRDHVIEIHNRFAGVVG